MESVSPGLAHDIGRELTVAAGLAARIRDDPGLGPESRRRLELVERELVRVQEVVARGAGPEVAPDDVSLGPLVVDLVAPFALSGPTGVVARPGEAAVRADRHALRRLLGNLVHNAVRAAGPSGRVEVVVHAGDQDAPAPRIEVRDDGPGPGAGPRGRRGLGLPTARRLARRCGAVLLLTPGPAGGTVASVCFGADRTPGQSCRRRSSSPMPYGVGVPS